MPPKKVVVRGSRRARSVGSSALRLRCALFANGNRKTHRSPPHRPRNRLKPELQANSRRLEASAPRGATGGISDTPPWLLASRPSRRRCDGGAHPAHETCSACWVCVELTSLRQALPRPWRQEQQPHPWLEQHQPWLRERRPLHRQRQAPQRRPRLALLRFHPWTRHRQSLQP